jgi:hypothetical protein
MSPHELSVPAEQRVRSHDQEGCGQTSLRGDIVLQVAYVGSQGHRLLATHDLNHGLAQPYVDLNNIATNVYGPMDSNRDPALASTFSCGPSGTFIIKREVMPDCSTAGGRNSRHGTDSL